MFGYLMPDKPYLYLKDDTLYKALYCGMCKSLKNKNGQISRFTLTYDIAFLSALAHNVLGVDVEIKKQKCIAHQLKKRPIAKVDGITKTLADINVILAYYKLKDDILDESKGFGKELFIKKAYKKAKRSLPQVDESVKKSYTKLVSYEKDNSSSIDMVADCFGVMLESLTETVFLDKTTEELKRLMYLIGKWIYLIDALDDYDKDVKKGLYNVFYTCYNQESFKSLLQNNASDIVFVFNSIFSEIKENYSKIKTYYNTDLVENILFRGIPSKTKQILSKEIKNNE